MNCYICLKPIKTKETKNAPKYQGHHDACISNFFGSLKVSPFLNFSKEDFLTNHPEFKARGMSISGVQPKLMMAINNNKLELQGRGGVFILKPSPVEYPYVSENEHVSMLLGKLFDIDTPDLGLVHFSDGELAYLITQRVAPDCSHGGARRPPWHQALAKVGPWHPTQGRES